MDCRLRTVVFIFLAGTCACAMGPLDKGVRRATSWQVLLKIWSAIVMDLMVRCCHKHHKHDRGSLVIGPANRVDRAPGGVLPSRYLVAEIHPMRKS